MPAIVGVAQVMSVGSSAVFNIGDVYKIMPVSNAKTFSGAGSFNTGESLRINNEVSNTNTSDNLDQIDQGILFNV